MIPDTIDLIDIIWDQSGFGALEPEVVDGIKACMTEAIRQALEIAAKKASVEWVKDHAMVNQASITTVINQIK